MRKGDDCNKEDKKELEHIKNNLYYHSDEMTCLPENSEEV